MKVEKNAVRIQPSFLNADSSRSSLSNHPYFFLILKKMPLVTQWLVKILMSSLVETEGAKQKSLVFFKLRFQRQNFENRFRQINKFLEIHLLIPKNDNFIKNFYILN